MNTEKLKEELSSKIKDLRAPEVIEIVGTTDVVEAKIKADDLRTVNHRLSSYSTHYKAGPSGTNLQLAARNINNSVVMPGETFSTERQSAQQLLKMALLQQTLMLVVKLFLELVVEFAKYLPLFIIQF